ncbi:MAG TPA: protein kinase [Acidimicrobiales bacterium]|nr:protein kinase [Acidimicrobiales bacterium]
MASQVADYEITSSVVEDRTAPCLRARRPQRLGGGDGPVTIWVLGPLARTSWAAARARLEPVASVRDEHLPEWLEAGIAEWAQRPVVWVSASTAVAGTLASPPPGLDMPARLRAIASAARGAHALHEHGQVHEAICPQSVALVAIGSSGGAGSEILSTPADGPAGAVLSPPALANGQAPLAQVGYPPLSYIDPQLLRAEGGRWSDIWALGATVHQVVTGSVPFPGLDELPVVQALSKLLSVPAPTVGDLPDAVSEVVTECLSVDPADRPATASEVAERLDEAASKW